MLYEVITATKESEEDAKIAFLNYEAPIYIKPDGKLLTLYNRITSYNVCYTKLLRHSIPVQ